MSRPSFRQRAAHLSYVAPLVAYVIWLQMAGVTSMQGASWQLILMPVVAALGGLFLAYSALRFHAESEAPNSKGVAWLGAALNFALLVRMGWALGA